MTEFTCISSVSGSFPIIVATICSLLLLVTALLTTYVFTMDDDAVEIITESQPL